MRRDVVKRIFQCDKCGEVIEYALDDWPRENACWSFDAGEASYGSKLDGSLVKFDLCDDCLYDFVKSFKNNCFRKV